jgi:hypothetical protein
MRIFGPKTKEAMLSEYLVICPWKAADGGEDLQIWRVAVNILNKQFQTVNKG